MSGMPLHPLVVHLPVVLVLLLPIAAIVAIIAMRRGARPRLVWSVPVAFAAALVASAYVATETGGDQEDRVERVVPRAALHAHEEAAELFLVLSGVVLVVTVAGFAPRNVGRAARLVAAAGAVGLIAAAVQVGHTGAALVYRYGAASAYTNDRVAAAADDDQRTAPSRDSSSRLRSTPQR